MQHTGRRSILVVEDDAGIRCAVARILEADRYAVVQAVNGREGLRLARLSRPDLVWLDLDMPVMDGFEMLRRLRRNPSTARIPALLCTALSLSERQVEDSGAQGYLQKPVSAGAVRSAVRALLAAGSLQSSPAWNGRR
ncbi:MAG: response regulator [Gemmatimonadota bacterium]